MMAGFNQKHSIKDIDFLPESIRRENRRKKRAAMLALFCVLLLAAGCLAYTIPQNMIRKYEREIAQKQEQIMDMERGKQAYQNLQQVKTKHDTMLQVMGEIDKLYFSPLKLMGEISKVLPEGVYVSKLTIQPDKVKISVVVNNPVDVAKTIVSLRRMGVFKEVEPSGAPIGDGEEKDITFEMDMMERPPEAAVKNTDYSSIIKDFAWKFMSREVGSFLESAAVQPKTEN